MASDVSKGYHIEKYAPIKFKCSKRRDADRMRQFILIQEGKNMTYKYLPPGKSVTAF